jgi:hypothetical protein
LVVFVWAYRAEKVWLAAVLLGVAIACKLYPVILLGICLRRTKYKIIPIALIMAVLTTVLSDVWLGPTFKIAATETRRGMKIFLDRYGTGYIAVGNDHSFFAFYKTFVHHFALSSALPCYFILAAVVCAVLYFVRIRKLPVVNQIAILFILSIALPPTSFDYTLLHVYTCWAVFVLYVLDRYSRGEAVPLANWVMFWFAFALAPHAYVILRGEPHSAQIRLIGLVALLLIFLRHPFPETVDSSQKLSHGV